MDGAFFKVERSSTYQQGQTIFRYLPVKLNKNQKKYYNQYPEYPIYAVLKPYTIDFYFHGIDAKPYHDIDDKEGFPHVHICILHLPLSLNLAAKDNLSAILSEIYSAEYELNACYNIEYNKGLQAYWNLSQFLPAEREDTSNSKKKSIFLRKLILDFIFDLERFTDNSVFDAVPTYEEVEIRLRENFFFSAISAKAAYYYHRAMYQNNSREKNEKDIWAKKLAKAEIHWLNHIRDRNAAQTFWHQQWFNPIEDELRSILFSKTFNRISWRDKLNNAVYKNQDMRILRESARFFFKTL